MRVTIVGGTGFIGQALVRRLLQLNYQVTVLDRFPLTAAHILPTKVIILPWDTFDSSKWRTGIVTAEAVINLAGAPLIGRRWNRGYKDLLVSSRIETTQAIVRELLTPGCPKITLINASAVGYYGDTGEQAVSEDSPPGDNFPARLCQQWESAVLEAKKGGHKVIMLRSGLVLGVKGGIMRSLLPFYHAKIGLQFGDGHQWLSWISLEDEINLIIRLLATPNLSGPINLTSPNPIRQKDFNQEMCHTHGCWPTLPIPARVSRIILGEAGQMLYTSQKVIPRKLLDLGYKWQNSKVGAPGRI